MFIIKSPVSPSEKGGIRIVKSNYGRLDQNTCTVQPSNTTFCAAQGFEEITGKVYVYVNDLT